MNEVETPEHRAYRTLAPFRVGELVTFTQRLPRERVVVACLLEAREIEGRLMWFAESIETPDAGTVTVTRWCLDPASIDRVPHA